MYLISACLVGVNCRYNGKDNLNEKVLDFMRNNETIIVCPEQLGGLRTPRFPAEIVGIDGKKKIVVDNKNTDVTKEFYKGAYEVLKIAKLYNIKGAILKSKSPSCGYGKIYDGSFSNKLIVGKGVTAEILEKNGIKIYTEEDIDRFNT
ncbi:DUF523 domain-containing protein [Clostridium sp. D2Q-14]|uniref:DUF523 domain-containing protein n=1 Tax=Anaeromonas gelatinilytica TaxID=2683194 RepID=UPI00193C7FC8|nr:DUF523 domain-containing protein [Anaeromonas gelatinilytica]MBS4536270.1 DUF523 domain-containing protein [Anaeromonas gelatinilytica]